MSSRRWPPAGCLGQIEPDELVVLVYILGVPALVGQLVVEDIRQALEEDQGEDVVLELGRVDGAADDTRGLPEPVLERGDV